MERHIENAHSCSAHPVCFGLKEQKATEQAAAALAAQAADKAKEIAQAQALVKQKEDDAAVAVQLLHEAPPAYPLPSHMYFLTPS